MEPMSTLDTSLYPGLIEGFAPKTTLPVPAVQKDDTESSSAAYYPTSQQSRSAEELNLSDYYDRVKPEDLLAKAGQNFVESAQKLDNTMVIAMQNGYSVQDVCNIRLAEMAYKANALVFDAATEISTFEVDV